MMRKQLFLVFMALLPYVNYGQESKQIDSTAIFILDKMADVIGDLESVSFDLNTSEDKLNEDNNIEKHYYKSNISFSGPDKLLTRVDGSESKKGYWYDGNFISFYNFNENNYVTLEVPGTTLEMIDKMHLDYDFQFPAADFFYPSFIDDMMEQFDIINYLGTKTIDNEECYHIMATNKDLNVQIWISDKTYLLPKKFVIIYKNQSNMQYETSFSNWSLNPNFPDTLFTFLPPPTAKLISIMKKS